MTDKKGDTEYGKEITHRLAQSTGHLCSVKRMVENGRDCSEVLIQLAAVKAEVNNTGKKILKQYMEECFNEALQNGNLGKIREINTLLERFL